MPNVSLRLALRAVYDRKMSSRDNFMALNFDKAVQICSPIANDAYPDETRIPPRGPKDSEMIM